MSALKGLGLNILSAGMVTAVGLSRAASAAALRGAIDGFAETQFVVPGGDWLLGAPVPLPKNWIGEKRLAHLAAGAVVDALEEHAAVKADLEVIFCLAETDRPGRPVRAPESFAQKVLKYAGLSSQTKCQVITHGRPSGFVALEQARRLLRDGENTHVLIVGADTLLTGPTVAHYLRKNRLLTAENANGFVPGEAAAAILCAPGNAAHFALTGLGLTREKAFLYNGLDEDGLDLPLRAEGMTQAYRDALEMSALQDFGRIDFRLSDISGEHYFFKQSALAMQRTMRLHRDPQPIWSPADCLGNIGAAFVPLMVAWGLEAFEKGYADGHRIMVEGSGDDGACGTAIFQTPDRKDSRQRDAA
ncbi:beta-ketoacyl synthase N-terminal-like domain-containing protein [Shimia sagamensis]|uniref:3-oxoacyl-[acyl-carrier-protein] synthase-1 n=1 Tax=Shimia sagamensis TaxID=1566352 RepID=A0ABY1PJA2_9RHOB|nr:beta-ketoacyl synthase N-terminal-like domain-containing protein [Shimia sagamensis]SMP34766.1 3-oxoacyl-[acyl-carrier-protein] synthase-1 [Shimia sagamensis]